MKAKTFLDRINKINRILPARKIMFILFILSSFGCAHFQTSQTDTTTDKNGMMATRTTRASATTFFDAKSDLARFRASQSDKTQSASVGTLSQEASSTNVVQGLTKVVEIINALKTP